MSLLRGAMRFRLQLAVFSLILSAAGLFCLLAGSVPYVGRASYHGGQSKLLKTPHETALQRDPPPDKPPYGTIVIAAQPTTDLSWTVLLKAKWSVCEYDVNQPNNSDSRLQFPQSKGHEAMIYLSYIIDHYDDLPWSTFFIHGHLANVWHQEDNMVRMISDLNRIILAREGYVSLRCDWWPSCPAEIRPDHREAVVWGSQALLKATEAAINGNWVQLFPEEPLPEELASPCCAQFAVTRQAILRRPKADYERFRDWLINSLLEDEVSGRVFEKLWAYIFLREAVHCPPVEDCACRWFGRCASSAANVSDPNLWTF